MTDAQMMIGATIALQFIGVSVNYGMQLRARVDTDRRLATLELDSKDHGGRISNVEGKLSIAIAPTRAAAR